MTKASASERSILILLSASYAVSFVDRALVAVAGAPIKTDLHLTDSEFGSLQGLAFALLYCVGGLPLGWLADRSDRRGLIALGLIFWSAMTVVCGLAPTFGIFFLARIGVGLGEACLLPAGMSLLGSSITKPNLGRATAIFLLGATAGNIFALLAGGQILLGLGAGVALPALWPHPLPAWRVLFLLAAPPGFLMAVLILVFRNSDRRASQRPVPSSLLQALHHLRHHAPAYGWLTAATACSLALTQAQAAWIPQLLVRHFGLSAGRAALGVGLMTLASVPVGQWLGGVMIDRFEAMGAQAPPHRMLAIGCALCLAPAAVFCTTDHLWIAAIAYMIFNTVVFSTTPAGLYGWQRLTPEPHQGFVIAALVSIVTLAGVGLGPLAVGLITDHVFHDEGALGPALWLLICVAAVAGLATALFGQRAFAQALRAAGSPKAAGLALRRPTAAASGLD